MRFSTRPRFCHEIWNAPQKTADAVRIITLDESLKGSRRSAIPSSKEESDSGKPSNSISVAPNCLMASAKIASHISLMASTAPFPHCIGKLRQILGRKSIDQADSRIGCLIRESHYDVRDVRLIAGAIAKHEHLFSR
jgi:hypothetical protein